MNRKAILESIEVWEYLAKHPEILTKEELPARLFEKIKDYKCLCPLCDVQFKAGNWCLPYDEHDPINFPGGCPGCPLDSAGQNCLRANSHYENWESECRDKPYAQMIVDILKGALDG